MNARTFVTCVCVFAASLSVAAAQAVQTAAPQPAASDVDKTLARIRTSVQDPLVTEAALESARAELQKLAARLNQMTGKAAKDVDAPGPVATAQVEVQTLLAAIEGRLGRAADDTAGHAARRARAAGLSVPDFEDRATTRQLANSLRGAQVKLGERLRTGAGPAAAEEQIVDLVMAEERLAWEAGWPFTPEETKRLSAARAQKAAKADVAAANEFDREMAELIARRRARGIAAINAQLIQGAHSVGRDAPPPFVIHRPATRGGQQALDKRLVEFYAKETGLQLQPGGVGLATLAVGTKTFDESLAAALRGER